jgi:uncharacterized protein (TIGR02246 family)
MKMRRVLVAAILILLVTPVSSQRRTDPGLTKMAHALAAAFNAKDAAKVATFYTDDATLMVPNQPAIRGRQNIEAWFKGGIEAGMTDFQLAPTESSLAGSQAFEAGTYSLVMKAEGGAPVTDKGKYVVVFRQVAGAWKIAYDIFNSDLPPAPAK